MVVEGQLRLIEGWAELSIEAQRYAGGRELDLMG